MEPPGLLSSVATKATNSLAGRVKSPRNLQNFPNTKKIKSRLDSAAEFLLNLNHHRTTVECISLLNSIDNKSRLLITSPITYFWPIVDMCVIICYDDESYKL